MPKYNKEDLPEMTEDNLLDRMHSHIALNNIGSLCSTIVTLQMSAIVNGNMSEDQIIESFKTWVMVTTLLRNELNNPSPRGKDFLEPLTDEEVEKALNFKRKSTKVETPKGQTIN